MMDSATLIRHLTIDGIIKKLEAGEKLADKASHHGRKGI